MEDRRISVDDRREGISRCVPHTLLVYENDQPAFERRSNIPDRRLSSISVEEIYYDASLMEIMQ
jgi:hypothetical protein